jgi:glutamate dehydrogenase
MTIDTPLTNQDFGGISLKKNNTTDDINGYNPNVFSGKQAQIDKVRAQLESNGFIPAAFIESEVNWFYK